MRTALGRALAQWRAELIADLGGSEAISTQQAVVIDLAAKTKLMLDSVDAWLLQQPSLINKRSRSVWPVVRERQALADALARYMTALGLERRPKKIPDLQEYLAQKYRGAPDSERGSPPDNNGLPSTSDNAPRAETPTTAPTTSRPT